MTKQSRVTGSQEPVRSTGDNLFTGIPRSSMNACTYAESRNIEAFTLLASHQPNLSLTVPSSTATFISNFLRPIPTGRTSFDSRISVYPEGSDFSHNWLRTERMRVRCSGSVNQHPSTNRLNKPPKRFCGNKLKRGP